MATEAPLEGAQRVLRAQPWLSPDEALRIAVLDQRRWSRQRGKRGALHSSGMLPQGLSLAALLVLAVLPRKGGT